MRSWRPTQGRATQGIQARCFDTCGLGLLLPDLLQPLRLALGVFLLDQCDAVGFALGALGGQLFDERWQGPGFVVCNAMDPEGNVFQVRETTA